MSNARRFFLSGALAVFVAIGARSAQAAPPGAGGPFGLGVSLGEPTGITGKYWTTASQAIDAALGFESVGYGYHGGLSADYLFHLDVGVQNAYFKMPLYLGPGGALLFGETGRYCTRFHCYYTDTGMGLAARMPLGVAFLFSKFNGEAFVELTTTLLIIPEVGLDLDPALGFRFYF